MGYTLLAMAGLVVLLIGYWLMTRRTQAPRISKRKPTGRIYQTPQAQLVKLQASDLFWGYRIESHCGASSRLAGRQFPIDQLPPLPMEGCTSNPCECRLAGLADQRKQVDRRSGQDRRRSLRMDSEDRRGDRPRRDADFNAWGAYNPL